MRVGSYLNSYDIDDMMKMLRPGMKIVCSINYNRDIKKDTIVTVVDFYRERQGDEDDHWYEIDIKFTYNGKEYTADWGYFRLMPKLPVNYNGEKYGETINLTRGS